jgi:hypothetical protein
LSKKPDKFLWYLVLQLRYMPITDPRIGELLSDPVHVTCLRQLRVLKISGGPAPSPTCLEELSALRRLVELEVLPGDYGCLGHEEAAGLPEQGGEGDMAKA